MPRASRLLAIAAGVTACAVAIVAAAAPSSGLDPANFDLTASPRADFYQYANGGWLARTEIPADRARWGTFHELNEKARQEIRAILEQPAGTDPDQRKLVTFYDSFLDEATVESLGLKPLRGEFARIDALRTKADVAAEFGRQNRAGPSSPLDYSIHQDNRDSTRYIVDLVQSGLGMPDREYYLAKDGKLADIRARYVEYVQRMLGQAGVADAAEQTKAIVALETRIATAQWTKEANRDPVKTYNRMTVGELSHLAPGIDWSRYLEGMKVKDRIKDLTVSQPTYVTELGRIVADTPVATWRAYLRWRVLDAAAPDLPRAFVDASFAFHGKALRDVPVMEPRWKRGVQAVEAAMGEALGRQYVARTFPPEAKARVEALIGNLLVAFRESIDGLDWMGDDTKREARAKLAAFTAKVGYPKRWRDYSKLRVVKGDLYGNVQRAQEFESARNVAKLGKPIDRDEWAMTPQTINAYYNPELNEIVFPAAILQPPFFQLDADDAVNYGAIGSIIGHEISHGFDDQGAQFDGKGNLRDWWTAADHERFAALTGALVAQYSAYEVLPGYNDNGKLTLGENIADNSGLTVAYKAYLVSLGGKPAPVIGGLTGAQRFYAGFATNWRERARDSELIRLNKIDPHSPARLRVRGALANQDGFFEAFGVVPGDPMYVSPEKRTHIW